MCAKLSRKLDLKKILIVSHTNIGDVVLTCPVIDIIRQDFPRSKIDIMLGPKAESLFLDNPDFRIKVFHKHASLKDKKLWFLDLYHEHYDCVIDLRKTALAFFLNARYRTPLILANSNRGHKKEQHLNRLRQVYAFDSKAREKLAIQTIKDDEIIYNQYIGSFLNGKKLVVIAPGAADAAKRWHTIGFAEVADYLSKTNCVVFVGDDKDVKIIEDIQGQMKSSSISLAGRFNLRQLAYVLKKSAWSLTHDSAVMHLASYFNVPLIALWGPTDIKKYGPWSDKARVIRKNEQCLRCQNPKLRQDHNCMSSIQSEDVIEVIKKFTHENT